MASKSKVKHALSLLENLERMKSEESICDFIVQVGVKEIPVHRVVLAGSSKYFSGLFNSGMKEVKDKKIVMKELDENAVEACINFIYTGDVKLELSSIQDILQASNLLELGDLLEQAFEYLSRHISPRNCLEIKMMAKMYNNENLVEKADSIVLKHFSEVISSPAFRACSVNDVLSYIRGATFETSWRAVTTWSAHGDNDFSKLCKGISFSDYPLDILLKVVLKEPLVESRENIRKKVIKIIFSNANETQKSINPSNCIELKILSESCRQIDPNVSDEIVVFMAANLEIVSRQPNFSELSKSDIMLLFKSEVKVSEERVKWEALMKWIKVEKRKTTDKLFFELFSQLNLDRFSIEFLEDIIRKEPMVEESQRCCSILMDALFLKAKMLSTENNDRKEGYLRTIPGLPHPYGGLIPSLVDILSGYKTVPLRGDLMLKKEILSESLPGHEGWQTMRIRYVFFNGNAEGIRYFGAEFTAYLPHYDSLYVLLKRSFVAGHTFRLKWMEGSEKGKIVWGDIPHKTNMTGGRKNNGFPDGDYLGKLKKALASCGIITKV